MKLRIKLTRKTSNKQVTFTFTEKGNAVLTGTCVGASDYHLKLANGGSVDASDLAVGLTVNVVFSSRDAQSAVESIASAYEEYGNGSPFITMVIECKTKKPTAEGNLIIMMADITSVNYEAINNDTFVNEDELDMLFNKKAETKGASGAAREASAPTSGAPNWFSRKVSLQERH
jgi:hypothetical protein